MLDSDVLRWAWEFEVDVGGREQNHVGEATR